MSINTLDPNLPDVTAFGAMDTPQAATSHGSLSAETANMPQASQAEIASQEAAVNEAEGFMITATPEAAAKIAADVAAIKNASARGEAVTANIDMNGARMKNDEVVAQQTQEREKEAREIQQALGGAIMGGAAGAALLSGGAEQNGFLFGGDGHAAAKQGDLAEQMREIMNAAKQSGQISQLEINNLSQMAAGGRISEADYLMSLSPTFAVAPGQEPPMPVVEQTSMSMMRGGR